MCSSIGAVSYQRNGCPGHAAAFLPHHSVEPQPHLVGAFGRDQQHAALALDGVPEKRLPGPQSGRQIEHDECLAGAPLAAQQPMPDGRDQVLDQPALEWPRIRIAVRVERRQIGIRLGGSFVGILIVVESSSSDHRRLGSVDLVPAPALTAPPAPFASRLRLRLRRLRLPARVQPPLLGQRQSTPA